MLRRAFILLFLLIFLLIFNAFLNPYPAKNTIEGFRPKYGVSYSFEQASWYGLDPRKAYMDLLDQVHFDWVRLPFFWDQMAQLRLQGASEGQADWVFNKNFEDLKWAIDEADKRNIKVVVALGLKTPYYPEYHLPDYIKNQLKFGDTITVNHPIAHDILEVDKKIINALFKYDNIAYWQVENEPYLANVNNWKIDESLIRAQVQIVRDTDVGNRPIILNHVAPAPFDWRYKSLLAILGPGDVFGVNAYFETQGIYLASFKIFAKEIHIKWPKWLIWPVQSWVGFSPDFGKLKEECWKKGIRLWVLEMQAEPYVRTKDDINKSFNYFKAGDILRGDTFLRSSRIDSIGLWGASYWLYKKGAGDSSWWETVKGIVN